MPMPLRRLAGTLAALAATVFAPAAAAQPASPPLTIERITTGRSLIGTTPAAPVWSPTSAQLAFLWNDQGQPQRTLWIVARGGGSPRRLLPDSLDGPVTDFAWMPDGSAIVFVRGGDLYRAAPDGGTVSRLTAGGGDKSDVRIAPDGRQVAWLSDGDVFVMSFATARATRLTSLAVRPLGTVPLGTYFRADVEIGSATWGGDAPSFAWSPDSRTIAVHYVDRRGVPVLGIPYYLGKAPLVNQVRRSAPGDANEVRKVGLLDVSSATLRFIELPDSSATRIVNVAWSPTGALLIDRESDDAVDRALYVVPAGSTTPRRIWHDHRDTRIYNDVASAWSGDGRTVLMTGDLDDRYRIYRLVPGDTMPRALTTGPYDVAGAAIANRATRSMFWLSTEPLPSERHLWRMPEGGGRRERVTTMAGVHLPFVSPDGRTVALLTSNDTTPSELYLLDVKPGATETRVTRSQAPGFAQVRWQPARYVTFRSRTDTPPLHARIILPPNLDSTRKYPVLFGPVYSNTVRNRWAGTYGTLQQYLAIEKGYIVVQVDVRGSTGYGRDFREKFLMDWGGQDLEDLESAVEYMKSLPFVDPSRLGIWGSSYGGTLTVYSLLRKPGLFQAGVAGAPATDPHLFGSDDVAIARRPQSHPRTFTRGALQYAGNLRDHLLIIHGMQDDVVPFATSVALAEEFMRLGKDVDFAFAPAATHGWTQRPYYARFLLQKLVDHFDRYLGPGAR
ncbi:MAG: prolyl oligopeptidase family serine peptidase [Gemmatimonadaceae bacterium]|nr:prolyl oligopeptidase family serine peptidase [Gemmatimonadaceae bacterium]